MKKKSLLTSTILSLVLFGYVMPAQTPVLDIDGKVHPNLAAAQLDVVHADNAIVRAQSQNNYDMKGHAERARELLVQVNQELKLAAEAVNAAKANQQKK